MPQIMEARFWTRNSVGRGSDRPCVQSTRSQGPRPYADRGPRFDSDQFMAAITLLDYNFTLRLE